MTGKALPSVSVCFPVYNEEETVGEVLREAHGLLSASGIEYEILVCDDASTDSSAAVIEKISSGITGLRVIKHRQNMGIRRTFEDLYGAARKNYIFLNSADRQWDTSILFEMLPLAKEYDIIVASRKNKPYGAARNIISYLFNLIPRIMFGVETYDAGAVKLVKRDIINRFRLVSQSPFSEAERLIRAKRAGYRIMNYPVEVSARKTGRSRGVRLKVIFCACADVFRVLKSVKNNGENI